MKIVLSELKKFLITNASLKEIAEKLTMIGLEVESVTDHSLTSNSFVIAEIISIQPHPNANKLQICEVDYGGVKNLQVICGANNARAGIKVVLARIGAVIPNGNFKIQETKIRDITSQGMLCSEKELLIGNNDSGIIELPYIAEIGQDFAQFYGYNDSVIDINVTPNRGDCLGIYGIARDLAAAGIGTLKCSTYIGNIDSESQPVRRHFKTELKINILAQNDCCVFVATEIKNLDNSQETPRWMQNFLRNIGLKSISPLVDITNYICHIFGYPIHVYDKDKLQSDNICIDRIKSSQEFQALDGRIYNLVSGDLVVNRNEQPISIAGIIGSMDTSCAGDTKNVILETAWFSPDKITLTGNRLHIDTDAKYRFERNVDSNAALKIHEIAIKMINEFCQGNNSDTVIIGNHEASKRSLDFNILDFEKKTGIKLNQKLISSILNSLGFKIDYQDINTNILRITIPSWRSDISIKEDIIEEILRIYGYNQLPEIAFHSNQKLVGIFSERQKKIFEGRRIAAGLGYNEIVTWSFIHSEIVQDFANFNDELEIINPISQELDYMRPSIMPNLLKNLADNQARFVKNIASFEIGPVFTGVNIEDEKYHLAAVKCGDIESMHPHSGRRKYDIYDIKGDLEIILSELGIKIKNCAIDSSHHKIYYHPTRFGNILLGKVIIGCFGEIHPRILKKFKIASKVMAMEIYIDNLPGKKKQYPVANAINISNYPAVMEDFAFVVNKKIRASQILTFIVNIDKVFIKKVEIFDVYTNSELDENEKKSLALHVTIQSDTETLTTEIINQIRDKIISAVEIKFDAVLRDKYTQNDNDVFVTKI